jgi:lipoate-protein ligase A
VQAGTCRLLPYAVADGPHNMAADEVLMQSAVAGLASLRFYGWSPATLSFGYFQPARLRHEDPLLTNLPWVRRPSGGATLIHDREVTYALALPAGAPWQTGEPWMRRMHEVIASALSALGVTARPHIPSLNDESSGFLCFRHFTAGDLLIDGVKVVGSAQRRHRGALLQHGAILLAASPYAPLLRGIAELSDRHLTAEATRAAVVRTIVRQTGWEWAEGDWTPGERQLIAKLVTEKYASDSWNRKR